MQATRRVPLADGRFILIDEADYEAVTAAGKWHPKPCPRTTYAHRNVKVDGRWTTQQLHTFLTGWPLVDHANGDGLDNRRSNLRPATRSQNAQNTHAATGSSGFKGVAWHRKNRKWQARITVAGVTKSLGYFHDAEEAAKAYDAAALDAFGEFAFTNSHLIKEKKCPA